MKKICIIFIILISCTGPSEAEVQARIDEAVNEATNSTISNISNESDQTTTTSSTTTTTTTTIYDSTCVDYANELIDIWDPLYVELQNVFDVYGDMGDGYLTYSQGANKIFEINLRWTSLINEFNSFTPNKENQRFHNKLLETFNNVKDSNEMAIEALDAVDPDLLGRAVSLMTVATENLQDAVDLAPGGTIYGLRDSCP